MEVMVLMQIYWMKKVDESTFFPSLFSSSIRFGGRSQKTQVPVKSTVIVRIVAALPAFFMDVSELFYTAGRIFPQLVVASQVAS
ncbi:uncharacterized protein LOC104898309 isoform X3 [Beta vulgaris subsp. vulgaris]|uniref:uncharacterized protein LOC104898309 isoform X3 n=1 Tax=Beta vulgaris subsp. vulgaris TaxID=3555 RepID=UPI002547D919|nr:uncharacterized protein LOC104898309 isoform X3 [Beta vulgaris subsp. vulgaris]